MAPSFPTATNVEPFHTTEANGLEGLGFLSVHVTPSDEVRIVPEPPGKDPPTATNVEPFHTTETNTSRPLIPDFLAVHVTPSDEVEIAPLSPTATNSEPFQAILVRGDCLLKTLRVHVTPSGEVRIILNRAIRH
jgi:hypothetical protein